MDQQLSTINANAPESSCIRTVRFWFGGEQKIVRIRFKHDSRWPAKSPKPKLDPVWAQLNAVARIQVLTKSRTVTIFVTDVFKGFSAYVNQQQICSGCSRSHAYGVG
jgi:hypothetical protein